MLHSHGQPPRGRYNEESFLALCSSQYTHLSLAVMKELLTDAVQSVTFNSWVNFAGDRIFRRRRKAYAEQTFGSVHLAPPTWQPPPSPVTSARGTSDGEEGAAGLCSAGTGFPSPTAHAMPRQSRWHMLHAQRLGIWTRLQSLQPSPATEVNPGMSLCIFRQLEAETSSRSQKLWIPEQIHAGENGDRARADAQPYP